MKKLNYLFLILLLPFFAVSCNDGLQTKHEELQKKETALLEKEKSFALKEAEYQSLIRMRDSLVAEKDTISVNPVLQKITGKWKGKIICTESNCQDYVVGDTRIDDWEISEENGTITAKNLNKTGVLRVYKGFFENNTLRLNHKTEPDVPKQLDMKIDFTTVEPNKLSGTREVQVNAACISKFSIELTR